MDLEVESQFNGKDLSKLTTLIKNQIIKSVKRKHTLPRYKVRYRPFFRQPIYRDGKQDIFIHNSLITVGRLTVEVVSCSRLPTLIPNCQLFCMLSVDSLPWKEDMPAKSSIWPVHEAVLKRTLSGSIGVTIRQSFHSPYEGPKEIIVVDTISPQSPANLVDIKRGDILLSVNDVNIDSLKQAIRLIKNGGDKIVFKLQRPLNDPATGAQDQELSDVENDKEEEVSSQANDVINPELESSFNVLVHDEDSDGDDFVNIVVKELEEQIAESDETARKILRKVSQPTRRAPNTLSRGNSVHYELEDDEPIKSMDSSCNYATSLATDHRSIEDSLRTSAGSLKEKRGNGLLQAEKEVAALDHQYSSLSVQSGFYSKENKSEMEYDGIYENVAQEKECEKIYEQRKILCTKVLNQKEKCVDIYNDSSDTQSLKSFDGDGEWDNISQQTLFSKEEELQNVQKTSSVSSNADPVWNEAFSFDIEKHHKFLNVCVWSKSNERYSKEVLLGYSSISLMELCLECLSTTSGKHIQSYILTPSYSRAGVSRTSLRLLMPGLKPEACNGDITLNICYKPSLNERCLFDEKLKNECDYGVDMDTQEEEVKANFYRGSKEVDTQQRHQFIATQFYFPTRCDYCQKKVWTKTAFQCNVCAMVSHKKCISNAHANTYCTQHGVRAKPHSWCSNNSPNLRHTGYIGKETIDVAHFKPPEGEMETYTEQGKQPLECKGAKKEDRKLAYYKQATGGKGDVNLMHSISNEDLISKQLNHCSKSQPSIGFRKEKTSSMNEMMNVEHLLQRVQKLQDEIFKESQTQENISLDLKQTFNSEPKSKLQMSLQKSEERMQALLLLMVQYEAALEEASGVSFDFKQEIPQTRVICDNDGSQNSITDT